MRRRDRRARRRRFRLTWGCGLAGDSEPSEHRADRQLLALGAQHCFERSVCRGLHFHRGLVGLELDERLAHRDLVADLL